MPSPQNRLSPQLAWIALFLLITFLIELSEYFWGFSWNKYGLYPRSIVGLRGIITAPFLHGDFPHWLSNAFPSIILSGMLFQLHPRLAWPLVRWLFLATGFWTWCFARPAYHIGSSGLVYGLASFLFFSGIFRKKRGEFAVSLVIIFLYSSFLLGIVPQEDHISWEAHLSGFIAGAAFAFFTRNWGLSPSLPLPNIQEEEDYPIRLKSFYYQKKPDSPKKEIPLK